MKNVFIVDCRGTVMGVFATMEAAQLYVNNRLNVSGGERWMYNIVVWEVKS